MTEFKRVFIDTAPFIYLLEQHPVYALTTMRLFEHFLASETEMFSSSITIEEYLIGPYRRGNREQAARFMAFLHDCDITIHMIDEETAQRAAQIRTDYRNFKAMDALQLASACSEACDLFLTNDKQLLQFHDVKCMTLDTFGVTSL